MYPLSTDIWMCVIFAYLCVSVVLLLVSHAVSQRTTIPEEDGGPATKDSYTILDSLWFALGAFMQQGAEKEPRYFFQNMTIV